MSKFNELRELTRVRVLGFIREPEAVFWVFIFPVVLATVLGFAFRSGEPEPSKVALVDGAGAEQLREAFALDEYLDVEMYDSREEAFTQLRKAAVDAMVEASLVEPSGLPPTVSYEPNRPQAATAQLRIMRALRLSEGEEDPELVLEPIEERGSRYVDFLFPGLIGMNLMGTGLWGIGFAIADVRRKKFLKRMLVTPMRKSNFFLSFMLSRLVFLVLEMAFLTAFGVWVLGVPLRGDIASFIVVSLVGAATFAGLGILVASRARTIEGVSGLMNFVMVPMWLGSGVFFSYERFPDWLHPALKALPLTALNDALRAVMIDGGSLAGLGLEMAILAAWCVGSFLLALRIFRWQ